MLKKLMRTEGDEGGCIARLMLGAVFFPHGAQKALGWFGGLGFSGTLDAFAGMGMPKAVVVLIILGEFLGSIGLIVGLLGRVAAFGITAIMLGAIFLVHAQFGFFMNWFGNQKGEGIEYHLLAIALAMIVLIKGSGCCSLDRMLSK
jgi:putative oxidoreductase